MVEKFTIFMFIATPVCVTLWYWKSQKCIILHHTISSSDDTDSKIAEYKQNSRITQDFSHMYFFKEDKILDGQVNVLKNGWIRTEGGGCIVISAFKCWWLLFYWIFWIKII